MNAENLVAWLPFDESTTQDLCGNEWSAYGDVSLSSEITKFGTASIHLPSGAYLSANNIVNLNTDKWTLSCWCYVVSKSGENSIFVLGESGKRTGIISGADGLFIATSGGGSWQAKNTSLRFPSTTNQWTHLEIDKDGTSLKWFQDGELIWSPTIDTLCDRNGFIFGGGYYGDSNDIYFSQVMFYEGVVLHTENFTPPTADDYISLSFELNGTVTFICDASIQINANLMLNFDLSRKLENNSFDVLPFLKSWLPFDTSTTQDICGNEWTAYGTTSLGATNAIHNKALQLNKGYLRSSTTIEFGGADFTISFYGYMNTSSEVYAGFCAQSSAASGSAGAVDQIKLTRYNASNTQIEYVFNSVVGSTVVGTITDSNAFNSLHHFEIDYSHYESKVRIFIGGQLKATQNITLKRIGRYITLGTNSYAPNNNRMIGTIDEFQIYDGVALHAENFTPPNKDKYVELLESMLISRHVKFEFTYDVSRYIDNLYSMFFDVKLQFVNASYYPDIYQNNPTAGTNDGTAVSSGNDYSSPISVNLDASKSESKIIKLSVRATSQSSDTNISIFDNRNHLKLSKNAEGPFSDSLTFDSLNGGNQIFYVQANSNIDELPSFKNDTKLITNSRIVYNMKSLLTFDDSTINDQAGVVWQANNGSVNIINGELQFDGNFYLSTNNIILGGSDFVIEGYFTIFSSSGSYCRIFSLYNNMQTTNNCISFARYGNSTQMYIDCMGQTSVRFNVTLDTNHYFTFRYSQDLGQITIFIDNELKLTWNKQIPKTTFNNLWLGRSNYSADGMLKGTIGEFKIFEGSISQQTSNISLDIVNPVATDNYSASNDITVWLPFTHSPTEDYCGNLWKISSGQTVQIDLDPDDHSPCAYIYTLGSHYGSAMQLDCVGMYIGGKDFSVEFDLWYGGGMPFSNRSIFKFGSSSLGDIGVVVNERFSSNWQQIHLHVFGQNTPLRSLDYRQWWHVIVNYFHSTSQISLFIRDKDEDYTDTLNVNIPKTFFPFVGIEVPGADDVANCYMRNFIIRGGETAPTCGSTIQLCVRYNNEVLTYPLRNYDFCSLPAFCVRYNGRSWYNILREVNDPLASNFYILHNDKMYALSK